jgi:hypothetical protein
MGEVGAQTTNTHVSKCKNDKRRKKEHLRKFLFNQIHELSR